jgi:hypothetical protein
MRIFYGICFLLFGLVSNGQKLLKGIVLDAQKNTPIPNASVFLNTTSVGTVTNEQGNFSLTIPNGKYELVISSIGYETNTQTINSTNAPDFITVKLKIKAEVMQTVIIESFVKDGLTKWGKFFVESFIGTSNLAKDCRIKNTKVIKFRHSKTKNELSAFADEPLIIENRALGYTIRYQMEAFQYDFKTGYLLYAGYPFFQPMKGNSARQKRWENMRSEVYAGSIMHFMRAVYRNKTAEEGFEINPLKKIPNIEKQRVKAAYSSNTRTAKSEDGRTIITIINQDTANYYNKVMQQSDYIDVLTKILLTGDSIAYAIDSITAGVDFKNYLLVTYKKKFVPKEFLQQFPKAGGTMTSQITLINEKPIEVHANGSYFDPIDLISTGFWAWSEKIATMLPSDYIPLKQ